MKTGLANLRISKEVDDVIQIKGVSTDAKDLYDLWGIQILDLGKRRFLFHFFHRVDIERVVKSAPWAFNNHLLVFHRLQGKEDPMLVSLVYFFFGVQVHNLPPGLFSKAVARQLENFVGLFKEYNAKQDTIGVMRWRFTRFYGSLNMQFRVEAWGILRFLGNDQNILWLVCGDFNEILFYFKKKGGVLWDDRRMEEFRHELLDCYLEDLGWRMQSFHKRVMDLNMVDRDDENLMELLGAKLDLNLEIDKTELFWEQRARAN
ncbi:hypothetical protein Gotri_011290 [Gossypium trilobum]|uniref:DUF4283 domain-containing protein n=1 Tax=Gossypium trilobum TaxID=34281 RepID=A0A7J9ET97_9ROSI|nr:hypothetical protein [Gossypium trilobum]